MNSADDELLSAYVRHKDSAAFAALVERYQSLVYSTGLRRLRNSADAEDVSQEVFLTLAKNAAQISPSNLGGWLYRCATNAAISKLRSDGARVERERMQTAPTQLAGPSIEWRQIEEILDACLAELPTDNRELIIQRFFTNRSQNELANVLGVDQATVSRRLKKAIEQLRRLMISRGVTLSAAVLAAEMGEQAGGTTVPAEVTARLTEIGGVGRRLSSLPSLALIPLPWLALGVIPVALVIAVAAMIGVPGGGRHGVQGPTASVATLVRPPPFRVVAELSHLSYTGGSASSGILAMDNAGQIAVFNDVPQERAGVYIVGDNRFQRLNSLPEHRRRSLAIGPGSIVVARLDDLVGVIDRDGMHRLTQAAASDAPVSVNQQGWVVFIETVPTSRVRLAAGDSIHTLLQAGDRFARFRDVSINDKGQVAFLAERTDGREGLFVTNRGEVTEIAQAGATIQEFVSWTDFNTRAQVAFVAALTDGDQAVFLGNEQKLTKVAQTGDYFASFGQVSLNNGGAIAFTAQRPGLPADSPLGGLYFWDGEQVVELAPSRQTLGTQTLEGAILCRDSLNDAGQIAVLADFGAEEDNAILRLETTNLQLAE